MSTYSVDNGTWGDVDYTAGCSARRANWPAQQHFVRIRKQSSLSYSMNLQTHKPDCCFLF